MGEKIQNPPGKGIIKANTKITAKVITKVITKVIDFTRETCSHILIILFVALTLSVALGTSTLKAQSCSTENEPNDQRQQATEISMDQCLSATSVDGDKDYLQFSVNRVSAQKQWAIDLQSTSGELFDLCILDAEGNRAQCRTGNTPTLSDLILVPGTVELMVQSRKDGGEYTLTFTAADDVVSTSEAEPNDLVSTASPLINSLSVNGRFVGEEDDIYRFEATGSVARFRVEAQGEGISYLALLDAAGNERSRRSERFHDTIVLDDLYLSPGVHMFQLHGEDDSYSLRLIPEETTWEEREPNDELSQAQKLTFDEPFMGRLANPEDIDLYRFSQSTAQHLLLTIVPPEAGDLNIGLRGYFQNGEHEFGQPFRYEAYLPAGDYVLQLKPRSPSIDPYIIIIEHLDPFSLPADLEPANNAEATAPEIPYSFIVDGTTGSTVDREDWYRLPTTQTASWVNVQVEGTAINLDFFAKGEKLREIKLDRNKGIVNGPLPDLPLNEVSVHVNGRGDYHLVFWFDNGPQPLVSGDPPAQLALTLPTDRIAAFSESPQRVDGSLYVENITQFEQTLDLAVTSSEAAWLPQLAEPQVTLVPGESKSVPLSVYGAATVPEGDVIFYATAANLAQDRTITKTALQAMCGIAPTGVGSQWTTAGALTGGLNVAWVALGAKPVEDREGVADLLAGRVSLDSGLRAKVGGAPVLIDLAGDLPITVQGVILNPLGRLAAPNTLRRFSVDVSLDGKLFEPVLEAELSPVLQEQPFLFAQPVEARFVRLHLIDSHKLELQNDIGLGEFKVIAAKGSQFSNDAVDLANPQAGGHVVFANPALPDRQMMLTGLGDNRQIALGQAANYEWIVGFYTDRAAQISELQWQNGIQGLPAQRISNVDLYVSLNSPMGPWQLAKNWTLDPKNTGVQTLDFDAPIWGRFLRFVVTPSAESDTIIYPKLLRVLERSSDDTYQSILAEWGENRRQAIYEQQQTITAIDSQLLENDANGENNSPTQAQTLVAAQPINGTIYDTDEDWYELDVPAGANTLQLTLDGSTVAVTLLDTADQSIALTLEKQGNQHIYTASVNPGRYRVGISAAPHSMLIAWDTTRSIAPYLPAFQNALEDFVSQFNTQKQHINLLPFGKPGALLLPEWSGDSMAIQQAFTNYGRSDYSNNAPLNLQIAAKALAQREGSHTLVLFNGPWTEENTQTTALWEALREVQPRIFAFSLDGAGGMQTETQLQDLAAIDRGAYGVISSEDEFTQALAQVACQLQSTARYQLVATTRMIAPTPTPTPLPSPTATPLTPPTPTETPTPQAEASVSAESAPDSVATNTAEEANTLLAASQSSKANVITADFPGTPGLLSVVGTTHDGAFTAPIRGGSVEIILDASGSMMQTLDDRYRIDIAREVLTQLVTVVLDPEMPLALRVFGHREPRSCRTDLEVPLARLDQTNAAGVIAGVAPKNFGMTPIAASLAQIPNDMASAQGARVIVLVTDGEETCDGDPAAEIQRLVDADKSVRINIVGFAVNDEATKKMFTEWAQLGHGFYFDATNALELSDAIDKALQVPFRVYTADGRLVTSGIVNGGKIEVPTGEYTVVVETDEELRFEKVLVIGGKAVQLEVRDSKPNSE